ncbi:hypothetical protein Q5H93_15835 [Hymenobacter sp. ASUV-10]|uniref:DUF4381 domain-containing protein n=1 Tax=Hymenobacter aranciens TaxID=3063996 RepID=A0ABT9BD86_9BACT|nr:hypothetical protein [Hymenobacter sp. ASUV-10]MDO7876215.1 hypothetical protein [Hymenobacter sp. ASUV-10]
MTCFLVFLALPLLAQTTPDVPQGRFRRPSTRVGEPLDYELRFEHAPELEVIFPDSTAAFGPFEYVSKTFYPTRTRRGRSLDRAVYHLRTFQLDSVQTLALPVLLLRGADTLLLPTAPARVRLRRVAPARPFGGGELPALRQNLTLRTVEPVFNYPYWLAGTALLAALLGLGAALFHQRLRRRYRAYRLRKNHGYFLAQFARHAERFELSRSTANVERAVALWKNYLASIEDSALNSFTTREIVSYFDNDNDVRRALGTTDKVIYGNLLSEEATEVDKAFQRLRNFAERRYERMMEGGE